ncbi:unnamed protein product [Closterium sp. Naga37s-1]|nr:unnamed protein product [Closterium sp. Naga37s-1]
MLDPFGVERTVYAMLYAYVADHPEACKVAGTFASHKAKFPCHRLFSILPLTCYFSVFATTALPLTCSFSVFATTALPLTCSFSVFATAALPLTCCLYVLATAGLPFTYSPSILATAALPLTCSFSVFATTALLLTCSFSVFATAALPLTCSFSVFATAALPLTCYPYAAIWGFALGLTDVGNPYRAILVELGAAHGASHPIPLIPPPPCSLCSLGQPTVPPIPSLSSPHLLVPSAAWGSPRCLASHPSHPPTSLFPLQLGAAHGASHPIPLIPPPPCSLCSLGQPTVPRIPSLSSPRLLVPSAAWGSPRCLASHPSHPPASLFPLQLGAAHGASHPIPLIPPPPCSLCSLGQPTVPRIPSLSSPHLLVPSAAWGSPRCLASHPSHPPTSLFPLQLGAAHGASHPMPLIPPPPCSLCSLGQPTVPRIPCLSSPHLLVPSAAWGSPRCLASHASHPPLIPPPPCSLCSLGQPTVPRIPCLSSPRLLVPSAAWGSPRCLASHASHPPASLFPLQLGAAHGASHPMPLTPPPPCSLCSLGQPTVPRIPCLSSPRLLVPSAAWGSPRCLASHASHPPASLFPLQLGAAHGASHPMPLTPPPPCSLCSLGQPTVPRIPCLSPPRLLVPSAAWGSPRCLASHASHPPASLFPLQLGAAHGASHPMPLIPPPPCSLCSLGQPTVPRIPCLSSPRLLVPSAAWGSPRCLASHASHPPASLFPLQLGAAHGASHPMPLIPPPPCSLCSLGQPTVPRIPCLSSPRLLVPSAAWGSPRCLASHASHPPASLFPLQLGAAHGASHPMPLIPPPPCSLCSLGQPTVPRIPCLSSPRLLVPSAAWGSPRCLASHASHPPASLFPLQLGAAHGASHPIPLIPPPPCSLCSLGQPTVPRIPCLSSPRLLVPSAAWGSPRCLASHASHPPASLFPLQLGAAHGASHPMPLIPPPPCSLCSLGQPTVPRIPCLSSPRLLVPSAAWGSPRCLASHASHPPASLFPLQLGAAHGASHPMPLIPPPPCSLCSLGQPTVPRIPCLSSPRLLVPSAAWGSPRCLASHASHPPASLFPLQLGAAHGASHPMPLIPPPPCSLCSLGQPTVPRIPCLSSPRLLVPSAAWGSPRCLASHASHPPASLFPLQLGAAHGASHPMPLIPPPPCSLCSLGQPTVPRIPCLSSPRLLVPSAAWGSPRCLASHASHPPASLFPLQLGAAHGASHPMPLIPPPPCSLCSLGQPTVPRIPCLSSPRLLVPSAAWGSPRCLASHASHPPASLFPLQLGAAHGASHPMPLIPPPPCSLCSLGQPTVPRIPCLSSPRLLVPSAAWGSPRCLASHASHPPASLFPLQLGAAHGASHPMPLIPPPPCSLCSLGQPTVPRIPCLSSPRLLVPSAAWGSPRCLASHASHPPASLFPLQLGAAHGASHPMPLIPPPPCSLCSLGQPTVPRIPCLSSPRLLVPSAAWGSPRCLASHASHPPASLFPLQLGAAHGASHPIPLIPPPPCSLCSLGQPTVPRIPSLSSPHLLVPSAAWGSPRCLASHASHPPTSLFPLQLGAAHGASHPISL